MVFISGSLLILLLGQVAAGVPKRGTNLCHKNVTQSARCLYLSNSRFLELDLPYKTVHLPDYIPGLRITGEEIINYSHRWWGVKSTIPKCYQDLQVALASILMPQCDEDPTTLQATKIYQPSYDICNDLVSRNNCKFLLRHYGWLPMFNCSDTNLWSRNCTNNLRDLKSSPTSPDSCRYPLVPSNDSSLWFKDITGCAMQCKYPIMNPHDHVSISSLIELLGVIGLLSTGFALVLYSVNRRVSSRMAEVTKQCTLCQLLVYIGWLLQFVYNQEIACSPNGASLSANSKVCMMTFFLTYAPSLSNLFWCAYLAKLCFEKLTGVKKEDSKGPTKIDKNIYLFSYGTPLGLFIIVALIGEIDSHGLYGICAVSQQSFVIKFLFLHLPTIIGVFYENFFFIRTLYRLRLVKSKNQRLKRNLTRIVALASLSTIHLISSIGRHIYELKNHDRMLSEVDKYLACSLNLEKINEYDSYDPGIGSECSLNTKPMTLIYYVELMSTLSIGIVIASWAFCEANFRSLRRKLVDLLEDDKYLEQKFKMRANENNGEFAEFEETYHDVIDVTTPNNKVHENEFVENLDGHSSLKSMSLNSYVLPNINNKRPKHHKNTAQAKSAREVINDQRQIQQQQFAGQPDDLASQSPPVNPLTDATFRNLYDQLMIALSTQPDLLHQLIITLLTQPDLLSRLLVPLLTQPTAVGVNPNGGLTINQPTFAPTRPPWADNPEEPQFNFVHGTAQTAHLQPDLKQ